MAKKSGPINSFTLIEVVISIAVLTIVLAVLTPIVLQGIDLFLMTRTQKMLVRELRFALNLMSEELKTNCLNLVSISPSQIEFEMRQPDSRGNIRIRYDFDSGNKELRRIASGGTATDDLLAERVRSVEFRVLPTLDLPVDLGISAGDTSSIIDIRLVQIRLSVEDETGERSMELVTRIMPRYLQ